MLRVEPVPKLLHATALLASCLQLFAALLIHHHLSSIPFFPPPFLLPESSYQTQSVMQPVSRHSAWPSPGGLSIVGTTERQRIQTSAGLHITQVKPFKTSLEFRMRHKTYTGRHAGNMTLLEWKVFQRRCKEQCSWFPLVFPYPDCAAPHATLTNLSKTSTWSLSFRCTFSSWQLLFSV